MYKIIFPYQEGIGVLTPIDSAMTVAEIARKDVPQGCPYLIVPESDVPQDRQFRDAWEADFSAPDGHGDPAGYWADVAAQEVAAAALAAADQPSTEGAE